MARHPRAPFGPGGTDQSDIAQYRERDLHDSQVYALIVAAAASRGTNENADDGGVRIPNRHADLLFELLNRRYEKKSTIVTTNKPFAQWQEVFPNAGCVVSLVDRLVHRSEVIAIEGKSYRLKEAE